TTASFFVFDASGDDFNATFAGHSGDMYLAALYRADDGTTDDWAISPELTGDAQTISFWACSYHSSYPEKIEMYYSTGSLDPADFTKVGNTVNPVPQDWTEYSFDVPAGAKHFAIRSCATGSFMLMLDDFTFAAAGATSADLSIVGYDVYRDGEKITAEPVAECEYLDTEAAVGEHSYVVVTVYTTGNSAPSNTATVTTTSGINDALAAGIKVAAGKGTITVTGAEGQHLTVAAADGKLYFNGTAAATETVAAPAGICIVKAGTTTVKVAVK
ncbi:MAG: choice-of-anchor J domain-containing protein, partial [Muribaculaceae bacterium]|nr:choice-of-anchor J domain-containing protein [Muribaculaceae bacterium]